MTTEQFDLATAYMVLLTTTKSSDGERLQADIDAIARWRDLCKWLLTQTEELELKLGLKEQMLAGVQAALDYEIRARLEDLSAKPPSDANARELALAEGTGRLVFPRGDSEGFEEEF